MGACRIWIFVVAVFSLTIVGIGPRAALAEVASVRGSAFGYSANVTFGATPPQVTPPTPAVTLPATGSAAPLTASAATGSVQVLAARLFSSGPLSVTTQGTTGATGSITSSVDIQNVNTSEQEVFTASRVTSTCAASETGRSGSVTITGGTLQTSENAGPNGAPVVVDIPANPTPGLTFEGQLESVGDRYRVVFNEQIPNADGSITVNAVHQYLLGPIVRGELIIGQSVCGVTAAGAPTTTTTTPGPTTTTTRATTTTTLPPTTTTTPPGGLSGGAFGHYARVSLFGAAPLTRGPTPTVTLPAQGSAAPVTASAPSSSAQVGPAVVFESGQVDVSTEGALGPPRSVKSSSTIARVGPAPFTADTLTSTCTAAEAGGSGSTTITNGTLVTSTDAAGEPATTVPVPANPAPNTEIKGSLDHVGDTFRWVFNEQVKGSDGSITVNAAHQYLLGPTATGEVIIGQARCATTAAAFSEPGGQTGGGTGGGATGGAASGSPGGSLAATGTRRSWTATVGMVLVTAGLLVTLLGHRRAPAAAAFRPRTPWWGRALLPRTARHRPVRKRDHR